MAGYTLQVPLTGAVAEPVQQLTVDVGTIQTGPGNNFGFSVGGTFRPGSKHVGGGSLFDVNLLHAVVPKNDKLPFLLSRAGLGLIGSTILQREDGTTGNTFDLFTPRADVSLGYGVGGGFAVSAGVSIRYLWHVWNDHRPGQNQLMLGISLSGGLFDPRVSAEDGVLSALF